MRAVIEAFVRGLPLDERARRVLDQTFFDWAHEAAEASRWWGRARVHARSIASVGRALALISVRNLRQIPVAWLAGRLVLFGVLPAFGFVALLPPRYSVFTVLDSILLLSGWLPLALFYAVAWRPADRRLPMLAVALSGSVLIAICALYVAPVAWWHVMDMQLRRADRIDRLPPLTAIPNVLALASAVGPAAMTAALLILAETVHGMSRWPRRLLLVLTPFAYAALSSGVWLLAGRLMGRAYGWVGTIPALTLVGVRMSFRPVALVNAAGDVLLALAVLWIAARGHGQTGEFTMKP